MPSATDMANAIWQAALSEPLGLGVVVIDVTRAKAQLYQARKRLSSQGYPGLDNFKILTSPVQPASELWIIKDLSKSEPGPTPTNP